ncbi:MAG: SH3 domain-containing protein [Candidatus Aminicenantaceae bacterium]
MKKRTVVTLIICLGIYLSPLLTHEIQGATFKVKVVSELANIRLEPDISSAIIQQVPKGTILESIGKESGWYVVKLQTEDGRLLSGYIHESLVLRLEPVPKETAREENIEKVKKDEPVIKPARQPQQVSPLPRKPAEINFAVSVLGGGKYVSVNNLNAGTRGLAQFYGDQLGIKGEGETNSLHLSFILGGELHIPLSSQYVLGIGADYFFGKKQSLIKYEGSSTTTTLTTMPKIKALPLRIVLLYYPLPYIFFKSGIEYYFAKCSYYYHFKEEDYWKEWNGEASARGLGILGGLGTEWNFSPYMSLIIEATGRLARIKGFKGKDTSQDSEGLVYTEEGTLYFYKATSLSQNTYPQIFIREKKPKEAWVTDPQQAQIDFSGICIKLGLRVKF